MYSAKKGFLLPEALLAMAVVSLLAVIVFESVRIHADIRKSLRTAGERINMKMTETYRIQEAEDYRCREDAEEDLSSPISSFP